MRAFKKTEPIVWQMVLNAATVFTRPLCHTDNNGVSKCCFIFTTNIACIRHQSTRARLESLQ